MKQTLEKMAAMLGTTVSDAHAHREVTGLLTDSRSLATPAGTLFFALITKGNDGHRYLPELYARGVRAFVVSRIPDDAAQRMPEAAFLLVDDTLAALQTCGAAARDAFGGHTLAITGSRGKTTLKEWIFQLTEPLMPTARSPRSWNSQIGVPLSLWQIGEGTELAVIEAGISRRGEMASLARIIRPQTVIFTNLGDEHSEGFSSLAEKGAEKALLAADADTLIYCADSAAVAEALAPYLSEGRRVISWTRTEADAELRILSVTALPDGRATMRYRFGDAPESEVLLPGTSDEDVENGANALAFLLATGTPADVAAARFSVLHHAGTRLDVTEGVNHCSIVTDSYTSDLSTLRPALQFIRRHATNRQSATLILSDPRHETETTAETCRRIADEVRATGVARFIGVGPGLAASASLFPENSRFFPTTAALLAGMSPSDFSDEIILLKGAPESDFHLIAEMLEARTHETVLEVNLDAVLANYNYFRSALPAGTGIVAMVKASGYGAGSFEIARTLQDAGAAYLAVAVLDEGIDLRHRGITMPIMVMNPKVVNYRQMFQHRLEPEIYSAEMLDDVIREARKNGVSGYPVHIKLDTGMHRMGFSAEELPALVETLNGQDAVTARSLFSHLATSDCPDMDDYTELQLSRFAEYTDYICARYPHPVLRHVLNSAGILRFPEHHYDMARLGIGLYGANTLPPEMEKPLAVVSTLRTVIIAIREYEAGETVGYGRRGVLTRRSRIATIPIGYADGMNRHFGRGAVSVVVNGKEAPTVGNICMDACMIDVTDIDCRVGDSVEIFGRQAPLQRLADLLDTIPYEVLTSVSPRVKRVYYRE